jgi:hypothetical protein
VLSEPKEDRGRMDCGRSGSGVPRAPLPDWPSIPRRPEVRSERGAGAPQAPHAYDGARHSHRLYRETGSEIGSEIGPDAPLGLGQ